MATGESNTTPKVTLSERQVVVEYPSFRDFISLSVSTLSEEGMFIEVPGPRAVGSRLSFVLRIADGFQLVQGEAEVVAVREAAAGQSPEGMSIRFQDLDEPGQRLLEKVVDSNRREGESPFVLPQPTPSVAEQAPVVVEPADSGGLEQEIPELAEIEASVRQEVRPPEPETVPPPAPEAAPPPAPEAVPPPAPEAVPPPAPEAVPPPDQSFVDVDDASPPSTLIAPPDDPAPPPQSPPPPDQSFVNMEEEASPSTLVTPPDDLGAPLPGEPLIPEPQISVQDLPPVDAQPPLPQPPTVDLPEIGGIDAAPAEGEDVQWEEPVAISPPADTGFEPPSAPPPPEIRFTEELTDAPVPDELVVASGALKWPDESGAVGETDRGYVDAEEPLGSYSKKRRSKRGIFLLLVVAILAGAAGYAYYTGLLQPYVEAVTSTVASFIEGESEVETATPVEAPPPIEETAAEEAAAATEPTAPPAAVTETPPVVPPARERQEVVPVVSKLSRVERITWEELGGETLLMLWTDDQVVGGQVDLSRIEGADARVIIKIYGVTRVPDESALDVGTSHIDRIRTGLHKEPRGSVLHVVADLTGADVYVRNMEPQGSRLQVFFAKR